MFVCFSTLWSNYLWGFFDGSLYHLWKISPTQALTKMPKQPHRLPLEYKKLVSPLIKEKSQHWCTVQIIKQTVTLFVDFVVINLSSMLGFLQSFSWLVWRLRLSRWSASTCSDPKLLLFPKRPWVEGINPQNTSEGHWDSLWIKVPYKRRHLPTSFWKS